MANLEYWEDVPVLGWAIDDWETFYRACTFGNFSNKKAVIDYINSYEQNVYRRYILPMFTSAPLPLNLGGTTEKTKLIQTSNPQGIFDFSLASRGLYKVMEYYSEDLAQQFPQKFAAYDTVSGIVPPNLVSRDLSGFYYQDTDGKFPCVVRQKGTTEMNLGVAGAKLKFGTKTKKSYLQYRKNRGKVKYVEIYSLFYYTSLDCDAQFAIRHIPALMCAEYLESIGIKVRFYMTRFVQLNNYFNSDIREYWRASNNIVLPLYEEAPIKVSPETFVYLQPILAKEFGEEINYPLFFSISSQTYSNINDSIVAFVGDNETTRGIPDRGQPDWSNSVYREGFERFRKKYLLYNQLGIFKSKELLPEAMFFFHDMVIKTRLGTFIDRKRNISTIGFVTRVYKSFVFQTGRTSNDEERTLFVTTNVITSPFFNWWMRLAATNLKNKVVLVNSQELVKDIKIMEGELNDLFFEYQRIINNIPEPTNITTASGSTEKNYYNVDIRTSLKKYLTDFGIKIMSVSDETLPIPEWGYSVLNKKGEVDIKVYVANLVDEITVFAEGKCFATDEDEIEKRDELSKSIFEALTKI